MESESEDETCGGFIVPDKEENSEEESVVEDDVDPETIARQEAETLTANLSATTVNGRTLRDRSKLQAPKDMYWERFGKKASEKLAITEHKREMLDDIKEWKKEFASQDPDFVWKSFSVKSSTEDIEAFHASVIQHFPELRDNLVDDDEYESPDEEDLEDEDQEDEDEESEEDSESDESEFSKKRKREEDSETEE